MLSQSNMTKHLDPEVVFEVLDCFLNIPRDNLEDMMNLSRKIAWTERQLIALDN